MKDRNAANRNDRYSDEPRRRMVVILTREMARRVAERNPDLSRGRFGIPKIDALLEKYGCVHIQPRFQEPLSVPEDLQEQFGAKRMFILLFPEDTPTEELANEFSQMTEYFEYAAPPPLYHIAVESR